MRPQTDVILDSIADGVFTVDMAGRVTSFNRAAEEITGVSREQALGQQCFDVFRANICQGKCALQRSMASGKPIVNERVTILRSDGQDIAISVSTAVLRDDDGEIVGGVETFRDESTLELLRNEIKQQYHFGDIVSKNHRMAALFDILPDVAVSESTVLIEGPSGSGKELLAKALHDASERREGPFVAVNCGALPDNLLESELFGYTAGAFTDAKVDKPGRFARAEGGTLFLDEIGDVSAGMQVKLLRVLQEKEYEPLGGTGVCRADVRIVAATNRDLGERMREGAFREDLYYRLNVVRLRLPSLRERRDDIPLLVEHFVRRFNARMGKDIAGVSEDVMGVLMRYDFPGNIRELENIIEHGFVLCRGRQIEVEHLPAEVVRANEEGGGKVLGDGLAGLGAAEAAVIEQTLAKYGGHRGKTAKALGMNPSTLWRKMKKYGMR